MSGFELTLEPERSPRRFEVITGAGGRRRWSADDKPRVLEETLVPGAVVSAREQLFRWRREARRALNAAAEAPARFVPAVVEAPGPAPEPRLGSGRRRGRSRRQQACSDRRRQCQQSSPAEAPDRAMGHARPGYKLSRRGT